MYVWSALVLSLQKEGMLFPVSVAPLCAKGQTINFSSPSSHMSVCSLKEPYQTCIKKALVNIHIVL